MVVLNKEILPYFNEREGEVEGNCFKYLLTVLNDFIAASLSHTSQEKQPQIERKLKMSVEDITLLPLPHNRLFRLSRGQRDADFREDPHGKTL